MSELRYDGRVAVITGAGGGLGRAHALMFGARGARVVVNDLGGSAHGDGKSSAAADKVVDEIRALGGEAVANYDSVEDGAKIVQSALDAFGRIDIVVNNAGILRDVSFAKMTDDDWDRIYRVHVLGAFRVTHAAWPHLREHNYGRVIMTASAAGLYGNFGQANYSMAKMGLVGFGQTLALEGAGRNVHVNIVAPIAGSRLLETVMPPEVLAALKPEYVSSLIGYLCHENTKENGGIFEVGGGLVTKLRWERTVGQNFRGRAYSPDDVSKHWNRIADFTQATHPLTVADSAGPVLDAATKPSRGGNEFIDVDEALGAEIAPTTSSYDERDVALYAIGVGAAQNPLDAKELPLVYERNPSGFHVLPTYGVLPAINAMLKMAETGTTIPGLNFGFERILHGEQYTEIKRPLPTHARLQHRIKVKDIYDKGKNAVVVQAFTTTDADTGEELVYNEMSIIVRGAGGWGGDRGPSGDDNAPPDRKPDATAEEHVPANQALLYRISGDWNPLHADPDFAKAFGFDRPILHGLCTFGYAGRHVIGAFCNNDPRRFKSIKVRFAESVFPGETLITDMWKVSDTRVVFRVRVKERDEVVISNAAVELYPDAAHAKIAATAPAAAAPVARPSAAVTSGEATSADVFAAIGQHLVQTKGLGDKTKTLFQLKLTDPQSDWILDLRSGDGAVSQGLADKADCTLDLSDADFLAMSTGKADAQKLYFGGKLKIAGNVMASQKLSFLQKIDPKLVSDAAKARGTVAPASNSASKVPPAAQSPAAPPKAKASIEAVFDALAKGLQAARIGSFAGKVLQFDVRDAEAVLVVDFSSASPKVSSGAVPQPDAVFGIEAEDLEALIAGKAQAQDLYQRGRLRVDGDVRLAQALNQLGELAQQQAPAKGNAA